MLFFEADAVAVEEPPDRSDPRLLLTLIEQTALDFFQCQVGLLPNQSKQPFLMLLQRRPALALVGFGLKAAALPPALRPADRRRIPNHKLSRSRSCRRAALNNLDHSNPQIVRIPHCRPPQSEKATESYSRLSVNPFDSQKMENALGLPPSRPTRGAIARRHERGAGCGGREGVRRARPSQGEMNLVSGQRRAR